LVAPLPSGFESLVEEVMKGEPFSARHGPRRTSEIWDSFSYFVFLDHNRNNAEVQFLYDTLRSQHLLGMNKVLKLRTKWSQVVHTYANRAMKTSLPRKRAALGSLLAHLPDAERSILEGALYFLSNSVSPSYLVRRTKTERDVNDLVYEWARADYTLNPKHIWRFGMTKSILMLNSMGLALDHCPPSWQVLKFVEDDLGKQVNPQLYQDEPTAVTWANAYIAIGAVRSVASQISAKVPKVTTADVGNALWYWKSAQHLLAFSRGSLRRKLTPLRLLEFLRKTKSGLESFGNELSDIDSIDSLTSELKNYLVAIP
jgi:hypothetical protein